MDHDGGDAGGREEGGRCRRFRRGNRIGQGSRGVGKSIELPGHQRKGTLERPGNPLSVFSDARGDRMTIRRRDFLTLAGAATLSGTLPRLARGAESSGVYDLERFGNTRILHMTDTHAQLKPVYFREPS